MKKIYHPYTEWEDYQAGMYNMEWENEHELIQKSVDLLSNPTKFYRILQKILIKWPIACEENLTNTNTNRRSWLGQVACCYKHGCPELLTRKAWVLLSEETQRKANEKAEKIIKLYEDRSKTIH